MNREKKFFSSQEILYYFCTLFIEIFHCGMAPEKNTPMFQSLKGSDMVMAQGIETISGK